ncbi:MAG: hypothetical protein QXZ62_05155 [Candidatus Caldarchaeum sp.]
MTLTYSVIHRYLISITTINGYAEPTHTLVLYGVIVIPVTRVLFKCPAAPYEAAFSLLCERGVRGLVEIELFAPEPKRMPVAGPVVGEHHRQDVEGEGH